MFIRISGQPHRLDCSFMTALRYRAMFGESFITRFNGGDARRALTELVYAALADAPSFKEFLRSTVEKEVLNAGLTLHEKIWGYDKSVEGVAPAPEAGQQDELYTLAAWGASRMPECALPVLTATQVSGVLCIYNRLMGKEHQPARPMDAKEQAAIYGIDLEALKRRVSDV